GGQLVYATCTFSPEENEGVIAHFLASHKNYSLVKPAVNFSYQKGRCEWVEDALIRSEEIQKTLRCWHYHGMPEGHFYAILRKADDGFYSEFTYALQQPIPKDVEMLYDDFIEQNLVLNPFSGVRSLIKSHVYLVPESMPETDDLRIIRPGLWVGQIKGRRFEPAHALALAMNADQAQHTVDIDSNGRDVLAYLHGEQLVIESDYDNGWDLITVDGFPLGWGKRSGKAIKNYYPKGLRWV
ncbi:MAG: RNA methyltransferase, partial [Chloroflexi bacterium]|nr:RNA methyltransferase [Chloroflexota bacterium]